MLRIRRRARSASRRSFALCVVAPLVVSCAGSVVETGAPSSLDGRAATTASSNPAPSSAPGRDATTTSRPPIDAETGEPDETLTTAPTVATTAPARPVPAPPSVPLTITDPAAMVPTTTDFGGAFAFVRGAQLWLLDPAGATRLLDDGPVGAVRAGTGKTVFFERIVERHGEPRREIWRVDVGTGAKSLVLPVPNGEFDDIRLVLVAKVDGHDRLAYSRWEWPVGVGRTLQSAEQVMYLTALDATDVPARVAVIGANETGIAVSAYARGMFVGTRHDLQQSAPAAFGTRGEAPTPLMMAALRCRHVCDGSYGSACAPDHEIGCRVGFTISPDGARLAWMESSRVEPAAFGPEVVGHDLVVVDVASGAEIHRGPLPATTKSSSVEAISWLAADRLLVSIRRVDPHDPSESANVNVVAQLRAAGADYRRLLLPEANDTTPVLLGQ